jgi:hypothetical protein
MYALVEAHCVPMTRALANEIATLPHVLGERPLKPKRTAYLLQQLRTGLFHGPTWSVGRERSTGKRYRINGQHSSRMLGTLSDTEFPMDLMATVQTFDFDSLEVDAYPMFDGFDSPPSTRTNTEAAGVLVAHHEDLQDVDRSFLKHLADGIAFAVREGIVEEEIEYTARKTPLYFEQERYRALVLWLWGMNGARHFWLTKRTGIIAEIIETVFSEDKEIAMPFWELVITESHPVQEHETHTVANELSRKLHHPKGLNPRQIRMLAAKWWRYYRKTVAPATMASLAAQVRGNLLEESRP